MIQKWSWCVGIDIKEWCECVCEYVGVFVCEIRVTESQRDSGCFFLLIKSEPPYSSWICGVTCSCRCMCRSIQEEFAVLSGSSFLQQTATRRSLTVEEALAAVLQCEQDEEDVSEDSSEGREGLGEEFLPVTKGPCQIFHFAPRFRKYCIFYVFPIDNNIRDFYDENYVKM